MNYTLGQIAEISGGRLVGANLTARGVMTDSRHSFAADRMPIFVAIEGVNHDGHRFVSDLYRRGVRAFMVEHDVDFGLYPEAGFVVVGRSLVALQKLAAYHRSQFRGKVVAITGSTGKTTMKEWIAQAAPDGMRLFRSPRSYNSQLGVALSLLMIEGDEDLAVIEAGISRPDEMARLEAMIRPNIGIFTALGP
ncbi:MAG: alanine racemase, partial [Tidjanibacter sp.]|nr:alanine racemase [Tidjanibacter sp.]